MPANHSRSTGTVMFPIFNGESGRIAGVDFAVVPKFRTATAPGRASP